MNILAISGSFRASSSNTALVRAAMRLTAPGMLITLYEGIADLPHFSPELDGEEVAEPVQRWRTALQSADGVLISTPEYAYGVPGSLKNALDWTVSSGEFYNKPTVTISASPNSGGGEKAHASLRLTLMALTARMSEDGHLTIPLVRTRLNAAGELTDPAIEQALQALLLTLNGIGLNEK